jgi:hypothetical protein
MSRSLLEQFQDDEDIEFFIREYVDEVWSSVSKKISTDWLEKMQTPLAADVALIKLNRIVSVATTQYDAVVVDNEPLEKHIPDEEPVPVAIDPWARGAVTTRKLPLGAGGEFNSDFDMVDRAPSVNSGASFASFASFRSKNSAGSVGKVSTAGRSHRARTGAAAMEGTSREGGHRGGTGEIIDLDEEGDHDRNENMNATGHLFDMLQKTQRKVNIKNKDSGGKEEIDKATKELKGKKFVLNSEGMPITIVNVKAENLPPYAVPVGLNISTKRDLSSEGASAVEETKSVPKKRTIRVAGSREIDDNFFTAVTSLASTLSGGGNIQLNPGVSMKSGDTGIREGPATAQDPKKVSRQAYMNKHKPSPSYSQGLEDTSAYNGGPSIAEESFGTADTGNLGNEVSLRGTANASVVSAVSMRSSRFPDLDPTEGGKKRAPPPQENLYVEQQQPPSLKNKQALLPTKPGSRQVENMHLLAGGSNNPMTRDRVAPAAQIPASELKRLPPPVLGRSTGHGTMMSPERSVSGTANNSIAGNSYYTAASSPTSKAKGGFVKQNRPDLTRELF